MRFLLILKENRKILNQKLSGSSSTALSEKYTAAITATKIATPITTPTIAPLSIKMLTQTTVAIIPDIIPPVAFLVLAALSERMFLILFNREHQQTIKLQQYKVFLLEEFLKTVCSI